MALLRILLASILSVATVTSLPLLNSTVLAQGQTAHHSGSSVPFGAIVDRCTVPGTVALTFDDGPYMFTPELLDMLSANGAACTFFLNGGGLGGIYNYADVVQRIWREGHQLGSHSYLPGIPLKQHIIKLTEPAGPTPTSPGSRTRTLSNK